MNYFVAPAGLDSNVGSSAKPFKTLQLAVSKLVAGDTLCIRAGSYAGFCAGYDSDGLYGPKVGTFDAHVVIFADPLAAPGACIINKQSNKETDGITIQTGSKFLEIKGLLVKNTGSNMQRDCIRIYESESIWLSNMEVMGAIRFGVFTSTSRDIRIEYCNIHNNPGKNDGSSGHGIYISNGSVFPIVRFNKIMLNGSQGIHVNGDLESDPAGSGIITGATIDSNILGNNVNNAINCDGMQFSSVQNNIIYGTTTAKHGISLYFITAKEGSKNNVICNNTIVLPSSSGSAIQIALQSTDNKVFNNILIGGAGGCISISDNSRAGFQSDYNIVSNHFERYEDGTVSTLAQWQGTGQDIHSKIATQAELFVNPSGTDFVPSQTSPVVNMGVSSFSGGIAPTQDALSMLRIGNPDVGAVEFNGVVLPPPVVKVRKFVVAGKVTGISTISGPEGVLNTLSVTYEENLAVSGINPDVNGDHIVDIADMVGISNNWNQAR